MKKFLYVVCILLIISDGIFGQGEINNSYLKFKISKNRDKDYFKKVRGSMYENADFNEAIVYMHGVAEPLRTPLRYNTCFDEMEMESEGDGEYVILTKKNLIDSVILNKERYRFMEYTEKKKNLSGYFIQLCAGECNLFTKRLRGIDDEIIPKSGYEEYKPPSVVMLPVLYFIQINYGQLELLPGTPKKIIAFFQQRGYDLTELLKREKIKNDQESLMTLVKFCNKF